MEVLSTLISVLLPIRQWRDYSLIAINSILQRSFTNFELLIIGDQPTMGKLREQVPKDSRIKCIARRSPGITSAVADNRSNATSRTNADLSFP